MKHIIHLFIYNSVFIWLEVKTFFSQRNSKTVRGSYKPVACVILFGIMGTYSSASAWSFFSKVQSLNFTNPDIG
jgi:hypothetical protein